MNARGQEDKLPRALRKWCAVCAASRCIPSFFLKEMVAVGFLMRLILIVIVLAVAGGAIFLATWDMPAPTSRVEKVIPAERFN